MVTVVALGLALVVVLAAFDRLELQAPGDLVLPLAGVAILSSLAPLGDVWLSDWIGWAFPVGVVAFLSLLLAALTPLRLATDGVLLYVATGVAAVGALVLYQPLTLAWHPPPDYLPDPGSTEVAIVDPEEGDQLPAGETTVRVWVVDGTVGPGRVPFDDLPWDPAEQGVLEVTVAGERVEVDLDQECPEANPCSEVTFPVELPEGEDVGLQVEFLRGDGMPFSPGVIDRIVLDVAAD
jgi:hypothetical protein